MNPADKDSTSSTTEEPLQRAVGVTRSERYLQQLCDQTFLSMWSFAGLFRDQGQASSGYGEGKEIADLLVVFENHILIFSDKDCEFPKHESLEVSWQRWFRKAVLEGAKQLAGAERWIRKFPNRLFLDRACTKRFPFPIPDPSQAMFHRIIVARGASAVCQRVLGGSGSLMINSTIVGNQHSVPFTIGQVNPRLGYVHVLDDVTFEILLRTLDTVDDFVRYLGKKEQLLTSSCSVFAPGEEELLARYLVRTDQQGRHDFAVPSDVSALVLEEGSWLDYCAHPQRIAQRQANRISYGWDAIIERFSHHIRAGTSYTSNVSGIREAELILRFLAREPRVRRRMLSTSLVDISHRIRPNSLNARVIIPDRSGDPYYIFLALEQKPSDSYDTYREIRQGLLHSYCMVTKFLHPAAEDIVGLATEPNLLDEGERSEDLTYLDGRVWGADAQEEARHLHEDLGLFRRTEMFGVTFSEYPDGSPGLMDFRRTRFKGRDRNKPCPCGSGRKYKHCHGR